ncbi:MAG: nucleotidyltransferase [Actinomycetota bacterium]|nr:nucleotidyltransferase [Actinomycetota bacterium]
METPDGRPLRGSEHESFARVLEEAIAGLADAEVDYVLIGGLSTFAYGRTRHTHDIDVLVRPERAHQALAALAKRGFRTEETFPDWLFKAFLDDVMVDVIFHCAGGIGLDAEMRRHARDEPVGASWARVVSPEDLVLIKAAATAEAVPNHWYDALEVLAQAPIDWEYLAERASRKAVRRMLALLAFAQSNDLGVPPWALARLAEQVTCCSQSGPPRG